MPATLEPPPKGSAAELPPAPASSPRDQRRWTERLSRSGYFLGAVLLHLLIFLIVATWVVFQAPKPPPEDFSKTYVPNAAPPPPPPPTPQKTMPVPSHIAPSPTAITRNNAAIPTFSVPIPTLSTSTTLDNILTKIAPQQMKMPDNLEKRLPLIKAMETGSWGRSLQNIEDSDGDPHNVVATFPVYLASYADGDWACNIELTDGKITAGSLPDLVTKINEWSRNNIKGTVVPTPLEIGGPDLMAKKPPFIFFTGHKDFVLTEDEITNLRAYLQNGGAIWGDNALPGYGSRFDVAFRREMKRVIPDKDKNFEDVPLTHDIFTKSWFNLTKLPLGMNYYGEPMQHLDLDGKVAILYTPNDYSDLFFMYILPGDTEIGPTWVAPGGPNPLHTSLPFIENAGLFFRNFTLPSALASQQLGMNILGFLLVRFDKELVLTP